MGLNQKKIVIVFNDLNIGGIETKIIDICQYYSKNKNIKTYLLLKSKSGQVVKNLPKSTVLISPNSKLSSKIKTTIFPFWLAKQFQKIKPNLIISFGNYCSISSVLGKSICFSKSNLIISDDSGLSRQIVNETFPIIRKKLVEITYPLANKIILLTNEAKNELIKLVPKSKNLIVIRKNWLPLAFKRTETNLKKDIDILFLGRFEPQKNPLKFLEIIKKIKDQNNNLKVCMVGYGSLKSEIETYIKKNNLSKNITIQNATTQPFDYYQRSKLLLLTSDYEGFPLTILESFSTGCVTISHKIPEIIEFFDKYSENILFTDNKDACAKILNLLDDSGKRETIGTYYKNKIFLEKEINFMETINEFQKYC